MKSINHTEQCRSARQLQTGLWAKFRSRVMEQLSDHVAHCPRCQKRLAIVNRVEVALMLVKTQPQTSGLLASANNRALNVLKHSLRHAPQADVLRDVKSDIHRLEKMRPVMERVMNIAACIFIVLMIKTGMTSSLLNYKAQGEAVIENYYAGNLDSQMFNELFPTDSSGIS